MIDEKLLIERAKRRADVNLFGVECAITLNELRCIVYSMPKVGEWILCSERMPEKATEVIACDADGVIVMGYLHKWRNEVICKSAPFITHNIVAWMPLPEPYKSGN